MRTIPLLLLLAAAARAQEPFEVRGWDIENPNPQYITGRIREAALRGVNTISLSHDVVMNAEEIIHDWHRYKILRGLCSEAHRHGMKVYLWNHQINSPPDELVRRDEKTDENFLDFDNPKLWTWLAGRYERVVERVPNFDGIVLSLTESQFQIHRGPYDPHWGRVGRSRITSAMSPDERMAKLINTVRDVLVRHGKILIVRDFFRSPTEMELFRKAMESVPEDVWVYTKCVPNDWQYCYPPHPLLGRFPKRKQVMELDVYNEVAAGQGTIALSPEYWQRYLRLARERGLAGAIARIEDRYLVAKGTAREFNIYVYTRLLQDPDADTEPMWSDFFLPYYGNEAAAATAIRCFKRSFEMFRANAYTLGFWTGFGVGYTDSHLEHHSSALWSDDPKYAEIDRILKAGGTEAIRRAVSEKERAEEIAALCLRELADFRPRFTPERYREIRDYFVEARQTARIRRLWVRAYYALRGHRRERSQRSKEEVLDALRACREFISAQPVAPDVRAGKGIRRFFVGGLPEAVEDIAREVGRIPSE